MVLTGRLALLAALGVPVVGLLAPNLWGLFVVQAVLLVGIVVDLALAGGVRGLVLRRSGDTSVRLGQDATVELTVYNPGRRAVTGVLRDAWVPSAGAGATRHPVRLPPGEQRRFRTVLHPTRRGDRPADRVTIRSIGPLGLAGRQGRHDVPWTVRALPPFLSRRHLPAKLARLRELDGRTAILMRSEGTEFDSLRNYVPGDDVRTIDWRATARANDVMVRTWRPERDRHVLIVVDSGRSSAGRVGDAPRLDAAMDAALLLAALASRAGDRVELLVYDRVVRASVLGASANDLLSRLVHAMAPVDPELVETDVRGLVSTVLGRVSPRSLVVLFTGLDAAAVEEELLPGLPTLLHRHRVVVAAVADPTVAHLAAGRSDSTAVYGAASAARTAAERAGVADLLRRSGVTVVDATPDELAPTVADTYLALKAAGKL